MKNTLLFPFLALFCSLLTAQTTLQYNLKSGDVFTIDQQAEQLITQELDGATHEITNKLGGILEFKVIGQQEDHYEIDISFKDLRLNMTSSIQGELMNVNAQEVVEGDIQSKIFNSMLNVPIRMLLAKTGDILEVNGGDSLVTKMAEASEVEDAFTLNLMKKTLGREFGSEALSNSYKQMTFIYPETEVSVGDSWQNEYSGKLSAKNTWTLNDANEQSTQISGTAQVIMNVKESATTMTLNGTQETAIIADANSGFITDMTVSGLSKGVSILTQLGAQEIPTTIKSTITYKLIKD